MSNDLIQLVYASAASDPATPALLDRILAQSRAANAAQGITGLLLHDNGSYFQVLEGPRHAVEATFTRIGADRRHGRVLRILTTPVTGRAFAGWSMGYSGITMADIARSPGLCDAFDRAADFTALDAGRATLLIAAFRNGLFRMREPAAAAPETETETDAA